MISNTADPISNLQNSTPESVSARGKISFLGFQLDALNWTETLDAVDRIVSDGKPVQHCVLNAYKVYLTNKQTKFLDIVKNCGMLQADGVSILWAGRLLGLPKIHRIAGIDLMGHLLRHAEKRKYKVYFLGASQSVLHKLEMNLRNDYPELRIAGLHHGYFNDVENDVVVDEIRGSKADILFVGISSPKKEYWLAQHIGNLNVPFCMGVGGSFDILAGKSKRAPLWIQKAGLEWIYRWSQEPLRLAQRYIVGNAVFGYLIFKEWIRIRFQAHPRNGHS